MDKKHIQTFVILTERARTAGLIQFNEMLSVLQALEAANAEIQTPEIAAGGIDGKNIRTKKPT